MSNQFYLSNQRRLLNLLDNGHTMTPEQLERTLDGLVGNAREMVRTRQTELTPVSERPQRPNPPLRLAPHIVEVIRVDDTLHTPPGTPPPLRLPVLQPPVARVMPNQTGGLTVRPSVLLQQMRASSAATAATLARLPPVRTNISWVVYSVNHMKSRAIGKKRFDAKCDKACAICWDTHTTGDSVLAECNHCFGKQCWQTWMSQPNGNQSCPECRTPCPKVIFYTQMAARKTRQEKEDERAQARSAGLHD
jgi:hypothetical protein